MEIVRILAAGLASYAFGAVWYMSLAKSWMAAADVEADETGRPQNAAGAMPYIIALVGSVIVAGMMRHVFSLSGIEGADKGLISGIGIGLFLVTPWIATNYGFAGRSRMLMVIDGGYATVGCGIMGFVLTLF